MALEINTCGKKEKEARLGRGRCQAVMQPGWKPYFMLRGILKMENTKIG
jgi:hypothetical protein